MQPDPTSAGHKYTDADVRRDPELLAAAVRYARDYHGDFQTMVDARGLVVATGTLPVAVARTVLNCARADAGAHLRGDVPPVPSRGAVVPIGAAPSRRRAPAPPDPNAHRWPMLGEELSAAHGWHHLRRLWEEGHVFTRGTLHVVYFRSAAKPIEKRVAHKIRPGRTSIEWVDGKPVMVRTGAWCSPMRSVSFDINTWESRTHGAGVEVLPNDHDVALCRSCIRTEQDVLERLAKKA